MTDLFCGFKGLLDPVHPHHRDEIRMGSIDGDPKIFLADGTFRGLSYRQKQQVLKYHSITGFGEETFV